MSDAFYTSCLVGAIAVLIGFVLRMLPHLIAPLGIGVDHWFWKTYIRTYQVTKQFPPVLPRYVLDVAQWYPPFFPFLMAFLPERLFDRFSHALAILVDLFRMVWVMVIVHSITLDPLAVGVAGGVYALTPLLISYNVQLNPRGLGAVMLDLVVAAAILVFYFNGPKWLWVVVVAFTGLLLLTHKMTTQLFWFLCLVGAALVDWRLILLIPFSVALALVLSGGFYWKVLIAHWDIVSFWYRNWRWLGANPVKESPIYGSETYETPRKAHRKGIIGIAKHLLSQVAYNPFAWLVVAILPFYENLQIPEGGVLHFVIGWLAAILVFALATALVPPMRCLGAGHLYLYNAATPAALLWGFLFASRYEDIGIILVAGNIACVVAIWRYYRHVRESSTLKIDVDFASVLAFLAKQRRGTVMCVPPQWYDVVAYKTGLPVLYGGHGYGFKLLEETYPRLLRPLGELVQRFDVRYIVMEPDAVTERFMRDVPRHTTHDFGKYRVLCLEPSVGSPG